MTLIDGLPLNPVAFPVNAPTNDVAVTTPAILTLSKFVCPSTSISSFISTAPLNVEIPDTSNLLISNWLVIIPTVTIPADIGVTDNLSAKFIVPAVPTTLLSSLITTPEPDPITFVNPEPSPTNVAVTPLGPLNEVALIIPVILTLPVPVIDLLNRSKLPPSWGVVSSTTLEIPPPPPPPPETV